MTTRTRAALAALLLLLVPLAACGDDDDDGTVAADETEDAADEPVVEDEEEPMGDPADGDAAAEGEEMLAFFQSTEPVCAAHAEETGNTPADPALFADATWELDPTTGVITVIDGAGTPLLVDVEAGTITGIDGPEGEAPQPYSFACPPDVYLGTVS